jgi:hypothetical protein
MNVLRVEMRSRVRAPRSWHAEKSDRRRPTDFSVIFRCEIYHPAKIVRTMATGFATDAQEPGAELCELIETRGKAPWNRANDNSADNVSRPILQLFLGKADADKPPLLGSRSLS